MRVVIILGAIQIIIVIVYYFNRYLSRRSNTYEERIRVLKSGRRIVRKELTALILETYEHWEGPYEKYRIVSFEFTDGTRLRAPFNLAQDITHLENTVSEVV